MISLLFHSRGLQFFLLVNKKKNFSNFNFIKIKKNINYLFITLIFYQSFHYIISNLLLKNLSMMDFYYLYTLRFHKFLSINFNQYLFI